MHYSRIISKSYNIDDWDACMCCNTYGYIWTLNIGPWRVAMQSLFFSPLMLILSLALPNMLVHKVSFSLLWEYFFLWDIELQRNNFMALVLFTSEISWLACSFVCQLEQQRFQLKSGENHGGCRAGQKKREMRGWGETAESFGETEL